MSLFRPPEERPLQSAAVFSFRDFYFSQTAGGSPSTEVYLGLVLLKVRYFAHSSPNFYSMRKRPKFSDNILVVSLESPTF